MATAVAVNAPQSELQVRPLERRYNNQCQAATNASNATSARIATIRSIVCVTPYVDSRAKIRDPPVIGAAMKLKSAPMVVSSTAAPGRKGPPGGPEEDHGHHSTRNAAVGNVIVAVGRCSPRYR